ncbi:MAG: thrombospondin type 3 repeat-containing protein, partial [Deltaproteobacteria bacterium]|nr:thrombospondin type 3 repeat-containing protein [Deltaproteobacteria bacterium]
MRSGSSSAQVIGWRVRGLWYFLNEGRMQPYALVGGGQEILINGKKQCPVDAKGKTIPSSTCASVKSPDLDKGLEAGVGVRFLLTHRLALRATALLLLADGRPGVKAWGTNIEGEVGATWGFGGTPEDTDKDGIPDDSDRCIEKAEDKDGFQDADGCPDEDNDGDGILDDADKCRDQPEDMDKFEDGDGCPELDNDKDGVPDASDKCPDKQETKNGWQDEDGCPDVADSDGDGLPNDMDKCPSQKEDKDGFQDFDGCPDPDNDGDGVLDAQDKCADKPETKNGFQDEDGC